MATFRIVASVPATVRKADPVRVELDELNEKIRYYSQAVKETTMPGQIDLLNNWLDHCRKRHTELVEGSFR